MKSAPNAQHEDTLHPARTSKSLAISAASGTPLSREQKAFNRELKRIEKLRKDLRDRAAALDRALEVFDREIRPLRAERVILIKESARRIAPYLQHAAFQKPAPRTKLVECLRILLGEIFEAEGDLTDADLRDLADSIRPEESPIDPAFRLIIAQVTEACRRDGIEIDLSGITPDSDPEELMKRVEAALHANSTAKGAPQPPPIQEPPPTPKLRPKTKRQLEREAQAEAEEEARKRTLSSIYKQLAKVLHPDLEPDPERKHEKLNLMQQLTAAYRANDLHTLLRLELEWLRREGEDVERLSTEKLKIYTAVLKEQAENLKRDLASLGLHPRFAPLVSYSTPFGYQLDLAPIWQKPNLEFVLRDLRTRLEALGSPPSLKSVRAYLKLFDE